MIFSLFEPGNVTLMAAVTELLNTLELNGRGEGFEPQTPWSRTWVPGANFIVTQSFEVVLQPSQFLAQSRQFWH